MREIAGILFLAIGMGWIFYRVVRDLQRGTIPGVWLYLVAVVVAGIGGVILSPDGSVVRWGDR